MANIYQLGEDSEESIPSEEELERISDQVFTWLDEFYDSEYYDKLDDNGQYYLDEVVTHFASLCYSAFRIEPVDWDESAFVTTCLDIMPVVLDREIFFFRSIIPVMSSFFEFLDETGKHENAEELKDTAIELSKEFDKLLYEPALWYSYLFVRRKAHEYEIDITDDEKLAEFANNRELVSEEDMKNFVIEKITADQNFQFEDYDDDDDDFDDEDDIDEDDEDLEDEEDDLDDEDEEDEKSSPDKK